MVLDPANFQPLKVDAETLTFTGTILAIENALDLADHLRLFHFRCNYDNNILIKQQIGTRQQGFNHSQISTEGVGSLSNRFEIAATNGLHDNLFVVGEQLTVRIFQNQSINNLNFYVESCMTKV